MVLLGTVSLGMPAIALSGGGYLAAAVGAPANTAWIGAVLLLLLVTGTLCVGAALSARLQTVLAIVLTIALVAVGLVGLLSPAAEFTPPSFTVAGWENALGVVGVLFFGLTGWEIVAFTLGEYKNPKRDFPRVVALSFVIVIGVYLVLAAGIQAILRPGDATNETAPVAELVSRAVSPEAAVFVSVLGVVILAANLVGAMWGASRLVHSSSGEGLLPRGLFHVAGASRTPRRAVLVVGGVFALLVGASALGLISVTTMFEVAGQNFFLLYVVTAVVYGLEARSRVGRCFGFLLAAALAVVALLGFDPLALCYPAALFMIGYLIFRSRA
ncbi:APC family permease [Pseudonocardia sp. ICBG601]|uniref:APC family permease n=1 Tax=Pseudonocardia sp. ICBG601 TaxID=2846759 RepID=UPI0035AC0FA5